MLECIVYDTYCNATYFNNTNTEQTLKTMYNITLWDDIESLKEEYVSADEYVCEETSANPSLTIRSTIGVVVSFFASFVVSL